MTQSIALGSDWGDFSDLDKRIKALERLSAQSAAFNNDGLQQGVMGANDFVCSPIIVSSNGSIATTISPGVAWVLGTDGKLTRNVYPGENIGPMAPSAYPTGSNYAAIGIDFIPGGPGLPGTVVIGNKGSDQATFAAALANPAPPVVGRMRIRDKVIQASGANFVDGGTSRDRRPWARGYNCVTTYAGADILIANATRTLTEVQQRCELGGGPVTAEWYIGRFNTAAGGADMYIWPGLVNGLFRHVQTDSIWNTSLTIFSSPTGAAGSFLLAPVIDTIGSGALGTAGIVGAWGMSFRIRETVVQHANNGTT